MDLQVRLPMKTHSEEETHRIAGELATRLKAGDVVLLKGDLGAGKTAFVRGLATGLGIDADEVKIGRAHV